MNTVHTITLESEAVDAGHGLGQREHFRWHCSCGRSCPGFRYPRRNAEQGAALHLRTHAPGWRAPRLGLAGPVCDFVQVPGTWSMNPLGGARTGRRVA